MQSQWQLTVGRCVCGLDGFTLKSDRGSACLVSPEGFDGYSLHGTADVEYGVAAIELGLADPRAAEDSSCSVIIGKQGGILRGPSGAGTHFQVHQGPATRFRIDVSGVLVRVWVAGALASELMSPRPVAGFVRLGTADGQVSFSGVRIRYRRDDTVETECEIVPIDSERAPGEIGRADLLILACGQWCTGYMHHAPKVLEENGVSFAVPRLPMAPAFPWDQVRRSIRQHDPEAVLFECFGEPTHAGPTLAREYPDVQFLSLCHTDIQTMSFERAPHDGSVLAGLIARVQASEDVPNYAVAVTRRKQAELVRRVFGVECTCMPHPVSHTIATAPRPSPQGKVGISLFGKHRVLKNVHGQVAAVAYYRRTSGRDVVLYYNAVDGKADPGLLSLVQGTELNSQPLTWLRVPDFVRFCEANVHLGLQCSLSETFNYTALDQMVLGIPVICSTAIEYASRDVQVIDFTDYTQIAERIDRIVNDYERYSRLALKDAAAVKERQNRDFLASVRKYINNQ